MSLIMNGIAFTRRVHSLRRNLLNVLRISHNAVRMAALMKQRALFVYTHDSIGLGEDGPTHQPVEQTTSLRQFQILKHGVLVTKWSQAIAWQQAVERQDG